MWSLEICSLESEYIVVNQLNNFYFRRDILKWSEVLKLWHESNKYVNLLLLTSVGLWLLCIIVQCTYNRYVRALRTLKRSAPMSHEASPSIISWKTFFQNCWRFSFELNWWQNMQQWQSRSIFNIKVFLLVLSFVYSFF